MWIPAGLVLFLLIGCQGAGQQTEYKWTSLVLPDGDARAGRVVFLKMGCPLCHEVSWETELPEPIAAIVGPRLDRSLTQQTSGGIASSIIAPSHRVPEKYVEEVLGDLSPMGDYTDAMTVRQLIDLVSYMKEQEGS
jgi:hypothetical protein